ncbi:DUF4132 domain-containing protein [Pseudoduganella sp. SL102]|uniref:DUF4132 domain-containing protein n=1 Tax=Pseudoduganella sp. SL102 TaxID=2995154 RepID=UPI00248D152E|nr:DUF4132 domain-containing protein [Pseudoduganella sp. SL102]WBS00998.1 DUF4132 domain-containing protein [Pseudoduganella sp. SL102]
MTNTLPGTTAAIDTGTLIHASLRGLDALVPSLGARAAAFVIDGAGAGVLEELSRLGARGGEALGEPGRLRGQPGSGAPGLDGLAARDALYRAVDPAAPAIPVLARLGKVLAAADGGGSLEKTGAPMPDWLHYLLNDALWASYGRFDERTGPPPRTAWTVDVLAAILRHEGLPETMVLPIVFERGELREYYHEQTYLPLLAPGALDAWLRAHPDRVAACAPELSNGGKVVLAARLGADAALAEAFAPVLAELACSETKSIRTAAARFVTGSPAFAAALEGLLAAGPAAQRANAVDLLVRMQGAAALPALERALAGQPNRTQQQLLNDAINRVRQIVDGGEAALPEPPPLPSLPTAVLATDLLDLVLASHAEMLDDLRGKAEEEAQRDAGGKQTSVLARERLQRHQDVTAGDLRLALAALDGDGSSTAAGKLADGAVGKVLAWQGRLPARPEFGLQHVLRWIAKVPHPNARVWDDERFRQWLGQREPGDIDLRQLAQLSEEHGLPADAVALACLRGTWYSVPSPQAVLPPERIWPYFAGRQDLLDEGLGMAPSLRERGRELCPLRTMAVLRTFPVLPARWQPRVLELAVSDIAMHRDAAQATLERLPDLGARVATLLASNRQEVRIEAAQWLARLGSERAQEGIPALHAALAKETREAASAAMLTALERLGEDIAPLLAPERLLAQAKKALKGKPPAGLAWFDMAQLPACRWEDGSPVPPEIIQWWVALAYKLKEPGGNPLFDRYLGLLDRASRAALGSHVLRQFIAQDTRGASHDEAVAYANGKAPQLYADYQELAQREPAWFAEKGKLTYEEVFEQCKREKLDIYLGTAINEKGILALASGMAGHEMVTAIRQYMRDHYPRRAQVEALLEAAAASDEPAAIQFVLATARRYRTRSVKEKARMLVDRIAARNGWSTEELADRTVPTGGLDDSGTLLLHYGSREFTVTLDAAMKIVLRNAEGKTVAALPEPRKDDDAEAIAEAKQQLTQCKKEVRQVIEQQTARLYEAMCAGRAWPLADWREYVERHPLVGRLAQRLVWMTDGGLCFRPAGDGTLVDTNDDDVALDEGATVRLAHAALLPAEQAAAWLKHFNDYKLAPLFAQMTRTLPALDLQRKGEEHSAPLEIADRQGWLSDAFTLRGAFTKLGYQRTADFEGHFFTTYHKEFPAAGIRVAIEFTGNALPEENVPAAVKTLAFQAITPRGQADSQLPLAQVPPVLLAEAYGDYHAVAASSRFDEQWQKKVPWQS